MKFWERIEIIFKAEYKGGINKIKGSRFFKVVVFKKRFEIGILKIIRNYHAFAMSVQTLLYMLFVSSIQ
jgi:hypothetical protein